MTSTVFTSGTVIASSWLNDVNTKTYNDNASTIAYTPGGTGAISTTVQTKLRGTINVMDFIPVNLQADIVARTSTTNVTAYIQAAVTYASSIGGANINFPAGKFNVGSTINWSSYVNMYGVYGETPNSGVSANAGTVFNWVGSLSVATTMFSCINIRECTFQGFAIEGNGATGLTAILYDSTDGSSAECTWTKFAIRECYVGVQWGTTGLAAANAAQGQFITFTIWSAVAGSSGIIVNSGNVGQQCLIEHGGIQCAKVNLDIVVAQLLQVRRVFSGGHPSICGFRAAAAIQVLFEGCSSENRDSTSGNITANSPFLYVVAPPVSFDILNFCINLIGNQCNNPILVTSPIRINSIGNDFGYCYTGTPATVVSAATGTVTSAGATSRVVAVNDGTQLWQTGFPYPSGWQPSAYVNLININPDGSIFNQPVTISQTTVDVFPTQTYGVNRGAAHILSAVDGGIAEYFTVGSTNVGSIVCSASATRYLTTSAVFFTSGVGTPEGAVIGPVGSLYTRTDGGASTTLYVKQSGTGNTGWVAK
jgi:hypothetical protein